MKEVRIKVGASADSSLETVFEPLRKSAKRAREQVMAEMRAAAASVSSPYRMSGKVAENAMGGVGKAAKKMSEVTGKAAADAAGKLKLLKTSAESIGPALSTVAREATRELQKMERESARAALGLAKVKPQQGFASRMGYSGSGIGHPISIGANLARGALSFGSRMVGSAVRGLGVETDIGHHFASGAQLERQAVELSNSAFMAKKDGPAGVRQDPRALEKQARKVGWETGFEATEAMSGLQKYVAKTGDLDTGRKILKDMAVLARATGASLDDMVDAAGDVANNLGEIKDKDAAVRAVMVQTTAAGKEGAVEIKDLASKMAKLAAASPQFAGGTEKTISQMVALAQEARAGGGAPSAAEAATAVTSFTAQFGKGKRTKEMRAMGIEPFEYNAQGHKTGRIRDPQQLIVEMLQKTQADPEKLNKMIQDQQAQKAVRGFANRYRTAYNETKGTEEEKVAAATKKVHERFEELAGATMSNREISISFQRAMDTSEMRVKQFNMRMEETSNELRAQMLPALKQLAPVMVQAAGDISTAILKITRGSPTVQSEKNLREGNEAWNTAGQMSARAQQIRDAGPGAVFDKETAKALAEDTGTDASTWESPVSDTDREALRAAAEEKKRLEAERDRLAKEKEKLGKNPAGIFSTGNSILDNTIGAAANGIDIAQAKIRGGTATTLTQDAQAADARQMQGLDAAIAKLGTSQEQLAEAMKRTLKVEVTNMPPQGVAPPNAATK